MKAFNIGIILCIIATSTIIAFVECCLKNPYNSSLEVCAFITKREEATKPFIMVRKVMAKIFWD
jgi:hypothetical protein